MTDINLKTLTPDTSLPTTGFLFGADSQASTNPSVYSTQTVATTLLGSTSLTGGPALTADAPVLNLTQEWSNGSVAFTGIRYNTTNTNSAAASLLMDLQVGTVSKFKVAKSGTVTVASGSATVGAQAITFADDPSAGIYAGSNQLYFTGNGVNLSQQLFVNNFINMTNDTGAFRLGSAYDIILSRKAAANLRFGLADAAAPVAQTLSVQSVVAGTSNKAGENFTITGSQGTGSGVGGSIIFQVAPAGGAGVGQNTLNTILELASALSGQSSGKIVIDRNGNGPMIYGTNIGLGSSINAYNIYLPSNGSISIGGTDAYIFRDAANTLALKNGANAQELRVYETTTGSIYKAILGNRQLIKISGASFDNGAGAALGTLANAPAAGDPTKWIPIDDNGTTRYIPAW
jgi:hypothetical protein